MTTAGGAGPAGPAAAPPFPVVHEDNHLLVIVKPAGLLSQEDRTGEADVLTLGKRYLKAKYDRPGEVFLGLVHRLDRPVSGLMVLARTSKAAARLSEAFRARTVAKDYLALVEGTLGGAGTRVDWLLKRDERVERVDETVAGAQRAVLHWRALAHAGGPGGAGPGRPPRTLVAVRLETGRAHQIRVQLAALGHPIAGDRRYGARAPWGGAGIGLHAACLAVEHPTRRVPLRFAAAPAGWPGAFAAALARALAACESGANGG